MNVYQATVSNNIISSSARKSQISLKKCPDPKIFERFLIPNCSLSYCYGIPKLHKPDCPMRPIISNVGTATRGLAGWLAKQLTPFLGKFSKAHLTNSYDFKQRMTQFSDNNSTNIGKLVSLDISSLFTNVPTDAVLEFIGRKIDAGQIQLPIPKEPFLQFIKLCVDHNCFQFENEFYRQRFGISMGSPLSPVLANLFMEYFESELLPSVSPKPMLWLRYVDDILMFWPNDQDFDSFFHTVNNLVPSINFTTEWEVYKSIPFLDTRVHRLTSGFSFGIYRKPTHSNQFLHYFSHHPDHVKRSSIFSLFLRAYRLCDYPHLDDELHYLHNAFRSVAFPEHVIRSIHSRVKSRVYTRQRTTTATEELAEDVSPPVLPLPYNSFIHCSVHPVFRDNGCKVVHPATNTQERH